MTRDEFIDAYMERSGIGHEFRTADGYTIGKYVTVAKECNCGDEICEGWIMEKTMTHDFKAALDGMPDGSDIHDLHDWAFKHRNAIRHALRIADKLIQEPSEGMLEEASFAFRELAKHTSDIIVERARIVEWKAMRDQMLKELEQ